MNVRAKFKVTSVKQVDWSPTIRVVGLTAVSADDVPENQRFHKYTPSGTVEMTIDNPLAAEALALGKAFYVDFTPVEPPAP